MNNRPAKRDGTKATVFHNAEGVECLNQAIYRDIQVLRTWETVFIAPSRFAGRLFTFNPFGIFKTRFYLFHVPKCLIRKVLQINLQ